MANFPAGLPRLSGYESESGSSKRRLGAPGGTATPVRRDGTCRASAEEVQLRDPTPARSTPWWRGLRAGGSGLDAGGQRLLPLYGEPGVLSAETVQRDQETRGYRSRDRLRTPGTRFGSAPESSAAKAHGEPGDRPSPEVRPVPGSRGSGGRGAFAGASARATPSRKRAESAQRWVRFENYVYGKFQVTGNAADLDAAIDAARKAAAASRPGDPRRARRLAELAFDLSARYFLTRDARDLNAAAASAEASASPLPQDPADRSFCLGVSRRFSSPSSNDTATTLTWTGRWRARGGGRQLATRRPSACPARVGSGRFLEPTIRDCRGARRADRGRGLPYRSRLPGPRTTTPNVSGS